MTVIYAVSGLAINHIGTAGWDPNFKSYERERVIAPIGLDVPDEEALARAQRELGVGTPRSWYRAGDELRLEYDYRAFVILGDSGQVIEQGRKPRFFLRVANWLHYNRGKQAWTYVADVYAILLLYLAVSGLFMIKGKMGLRWRGAAFALAGISVPVAYVVWSGGPEAASRKRPPPGIEATGAPPAAAGDAAPTAPDTPSSGEPDSTSGEPDSPSGEPDDFPRLQPRRPDPPLPLPPRSP